MKTTRQILLENNFFNPSYYFSSFYGKMLIDLERFSCQIDEPTNNGIKKYEGVIPTEYGFAILIDHGKLCEHSLIKFPKYVTEENFEGAFNRLMNFIKANYKWQAGLPPYLFGD